MFVGVFVVYPGVCGRLFARAMNTQPLINTPEIIKLIGEIDEFKGAWRALGSLAPDRLKALRKVAL